MNIIIKPSGNICNLSCRYCFNGNEISENSSNVFLDINEAYKIIDNIVKSNNEEIDLSFQGGEPLIIGVEFYNNLFSYIETNYKNKIFRYVFQTNGILINEEWIELFKKYNVLLGISCDGEKEIHNFNRITNNGLPTHDIVTKNIQKLRDANLEFNILMVVTKTNIKNFSNNILYNYKFTKFIQCIPYVGEQEEFLLSKKEYTNYLETMQKIHLQYNDIRIRTIDNFLNIKKGIKPDICTMSGNCSFHCVVYPNGDVFPCDFFTNKKYKIGNLIFETYNDIKQDKKVKTFISESNYIHFNCISCNVFKYCRGGCKMDRGNDLLHYAHCDETRKFIEEWYSN